MGAGELPVGQAGCSHVSGTIHGPAWSAQGPARAAGVNFDCLTLPSQITVLTFEFRVQQHINYDISL